MQLLAIDVRPGVFRPLYLARTAGDSLANRFSLYVLSRDGQARMGNCGLLPLESR